MTETFTNEERAARRRLCADDVRSGLSIAQAALKRGVSIATVYAACQEHGVGRRPTVDTSLVCAVLYDLLHTDETLGDLGLKHQLSPSRINKVLSAARDAGFRFHQREDRKGRES